MTAVGSSVARLGRASAPPGLARGGAILRRDRVRERESGAADIRVRSGDRARVGCRVGAVEAGHRDVELLPEFRRSSPTCSGPKLVRRLGALRPGNRTPGEPEIGGIAAHRCLFCGGLAKGSEPRGKPGIRRRESVGPHRSAPVVLGLLEPVKQLALAGRSCCRIQRLLPSWWHFSQLPEFSSGSTNPRRAFSSQPPAAVAGPLSSEASRRSKSSRGTRHTLRTRMPRNRPFSIQSRTACGDICNRLAIWLTVKNSGWSA